MFQTQSVGISEKARLGLDILKLGYHRMLMVSKSTEINQSDDMGYNLRVLNNEF